MTSRQRKDVFFRNANELRRIARQGDPSRLAALDIGDLVAGGPPRGMQARLAEHLLCRLTDMSPENTDRLRTIVSVPIGCRKWGERDDNPASQPVDRMIMRTAAAMTLVRLGIHPVAYALCNTITPLCLTARGVEIGTTLNQTSRGIEMLLRFWEPAEKVEWTPRPRLIRIKGAEVPETMLTALPGMPLTALVKHPLTDLIDVPIKDIDQRRSGEGDDIIITCKARVDEIRMEDLDPAELAGASLRAK